LEYQTYGTVSTEFTISPNITVSFTGDNGEKVYSFTVRDARSLSYIAPRLGLDSELKKTLRRLGEVYTLLSGGTVYFGAKKRLEEVV